MLFLLIALKYFEVEFRVQLGVMFQSTYRHIITSKKTVILLAQEIKHMRFVRIYYNIIFNIYNNYIRTIYETC